MKAFFDAILRLFMARPSPKPSTTGGRIAKRATGVAASMAVAVAFIGGWEGLRTTAYQDIVGVWTVCYGETAGIRPGDRYTTAECDSMFGARILQFEREIDACLTREETIPTGAKIAFVSWAYNVGSSAACKSTLVRKANAGDLRGACNELPRWNKAGGSTIKGLTNRRGAERAMCLNAL